MPNAVPIACSEPRCPDYAVPGGRGRCARHKRTNAERGYPRWRWEAASRAQRARVPYCERCGATSDLVADHIVNGDPSRLQTLCRSCNTAKRNAENGGMRGEGSPRSRGSPPAYPRSDSRTPSVTRHGGQSKSATPADPVDAWLAEGATDA